MQYYQKKMRFLQWNDVLFHFTLQNALHNFPSTCKLEYDVNISGNFLGTENWGNT